MTLTLDRVIVGDMTENDSSKPKYTRKTPRITTSSVYLGDRELRLAREKRLDEIAERLGVKNRSILIQMIADGLLTITPTEE